MRIGLAIDPATRDVFLRPDGNLAMVTDAEAVAQHVMQRLHLFRGEWFLNTDAGTPWLDEIFGKGYDEALAEAVVKSEVMGTDGVTDITAFSVGFERSTRAVIVKEMEIKTTYDEI